MKNNKQLLEHLDGVQKQLNEIKKLIHDKDQLDEQMQLVKKARERNEKRLIERERKQEIRQKELDKMSDELRRKSEERMHQNKIEVREEFLLHCKTKGLNPTLELFLLWTLNK